MINQHTKRKKKSIRQWITFCYVFEELIGVCTHIYMHRAPIYNFSATISLHFILQLLILAVLFPREPQKQATNLPFSFFLLSPFEWGWDRENNVRLRSCCYAIKRHKLLDLGVGIQKSFLYTLHNAINFSIASCSTWHIQNHFVFCGLKCATALPSEAVLTSLNLFPPDPSSL